MKRKRARINESTSRLAPLPDARNQTEEKKISPNVTFTRSLKLVFSLHVIQSPEFSVKSFARPSHSSLPKTNSPTHRRESTGPANPYRQSKTAYTITMTILLCRLICRWGGVRSSSKRGLQSLPPPITYTIVPRQSQVIRCESPSLSPLPAFSGATG